MALAILGFPLGRREKREESAIRTLGAASRQPRAQDRGCPLSAHDLAQSSQPLTKGRRNVHNQPIDASLDSEPRHR
jgi:hypothetical protein